MADEEVRCALIGIIVEDKRNIGRLNEILFEYSEYIFGRMGVPHRNNGISLISVAVEAPLTMINSLSGKIGMIDGITSKVIYAKK